ncbi:MAG: divergent polysaccharide deacetylase family protein [Cloacibacillus sp.]
MGRHFKDQDKKSLIKPALLLLLAAALVFGVFFLSGGRIGTKKTEDYSQSAPASKEAAHLLKSADVTPALSGDAHSADSFNGVSSTDIMKDKIKELSASKDKSETQEPSYEKKYKFERPLVAIIVDDGGAQMDLTKRVAALALPLTWAIMPYQRYSSECAETARAQNIPYLLHMPMQAVIDKDSSQYIIGGDMSDAEVAAACEKALDSLPGAIGMNNHRGSRATSQKNLMEPVMETLKKRGLLFVDSRTHNKSVAYKTALAAGLPALRNGGFLDNTPDKRAITARFDEVVKTAQKSGHAVVICHFRPATIMFLEELNKNYKDLPVKLVTAPEMLNEMKQAEQKAADQL